MTKYVDLIEVQYQRGECARVLEDCREMFKEFKHNRDIAPDRDTRAHYESLMAETASNILTLEATIAKWDELTPLFMKYDDAIKVLQRLYRNESFYHFTGFTYSYSTDSRFDHEAIMRALRSTGTLFYYLETQHESYWRFNMTFTPAVLAAMEKEPTPEKPARRGRKR